MDLNEKLDSNKMSAVQSFGMIVRSALIDHEDRIKKIERAALERRDTYDKESEEWMNAPMGMPAPTTPTVERFMMWGNVNTNWDSPIIGLRGVTQRKRGEVVATWESPYWVIQFPTGDILRLAQSRYDIFKRNGCFGKQVK